MRRVSTTRASIMMHLPKASMTKANIFSCRPTAIDRHHFHICFSQCAIHCCMKPYKAALATSTHPTHDERQSSNISCLPKLLDGEQSVLSIPCQSHDSVLNDLQPTANKKHSCSTIFILFSLCATSDKYLCNSATHSAIDERPAGLPAACLVYGLRQKMPTQPCLCTSQLLGTTHSQASCCACVFLGG